MLTVRCLAACGCQDKATFVWKAKKPIWCLLENTALGGIDRLVRSPFAVGPVLQFVAPLLAAHFCTAISEQE